MASLLMQETATDTKPDVEVESVRFLQKPGSTIGTLSVVVGGVHYLWPCRRVKMLTAGESMFEVMRRQEGG